MNVVDAVNLLEIPWWIGCGVYVAFRSWRTARPQRRRGLFAAVSLLLFGLSDVVELQTGAWWRPWWLAVWKGACLVSILICLMLHRRDEQHSRSGSAETPATPE